MRTLLFLMAAVFASLLCQMVLWDLFGPYWAIDCLLITIVFFHLWKGSRVALTAALVAGWLRDSLSAAYGESLLAFIFVCTVVTFAKMFVYHPGSRLSKMGLTAVASMIYLVVVVVLWSVRKGQWSLGDWDEIFVTQVVLTSVVSPFWMEGLRRCALKFSA